MAYWYDDASPGGNTSRRVIDFIADTDSDIDDLPTSITEGKPQENDTTLHKCVEKGSSCLVIESSSLYMLNSDDQWVQM